MLDIDEATKALLKTDSVYKEMYVTISNTGSPYIFENEDIYYEAFELKESILDGSDMTFMGCIASEMRITIRNRDNLKDYALNNRKITVEMTPYAIENTKNKMPSLYTKGDEYVINGITFKVNDDLSIKVTGRATADTYFPVADFMSDDNATWLLSGCQNGGLYVKQGKLSVYDADTEQLKTSYNDVGSDVSVVMTKGDIYRYEIFIASGQGLNDTFYPMLRETTETNEYEPYGNKYIEHETIPLFYGYIDSGEYDKDKSWLKLTAYDVMYRLNTFNVWNWYNKIAFTAASTASDRNAKRIPLDELLDSFVSYVNTYSGYELSLSERCPVILSDVKIKKRLKNKEMTATNFLKSFCQLACACALINREGELQLIYRNSQVTEVDTIPYYRSLTSKDYVIQPFAQGITIRTNSEDNGVTLTSPTTITVDWDDSSNDNFIIDDTDEIVNVGKYFIDSNGLVTKLSKTKRQAIINILLNNVQNADYYSFKSYELICNALPYIECGDDIKCMGESEPEEHTNVPFSNNYSLSIDNSDGIEAPISFEITFTQIYTPLDPQYFRNCPVCMGSADYPLSSQPKYFGVDVEKCIQLIGKTTSDTIVGDKIILSNYNGVSVMIYKSLENGEYVDYDVSSCMFSYTVEGETVYCDHDLFIPADSEITFDKATFGGPFDSTTTATYTLTKTEVKLQSPVVNRTIKGIQAMTDTFSFELPDTFQKFGGTTSGEKDSNISNDTNTTAAQLNGEEVMIVVSFDSNTGILETTSKVI